MSGGEPFWLNDSYFLTDMSSITADKAEYTGTPGVGHIIAVCLYLVIALIGISGNTLVILSMIMCRRLQTSANAFVVALSVSDFLTSLTLPIHGAALLGIWSSVFFFFCSIAAISSYILTGSNVYLLMAIAFNRYIHITKPSQTYRKCFQKKLVAFMIALCFLIPFLATVLAHVLGAASSGICPNYKANVNTCTIWGQIFDYVAASFILTPLVFTLVFYILIYAQIRYHFRAVAVRVSHDDNISVISGDHRATVSGDFSPRSRETSGLPDVHCQVNAPSFHDHPDTNHPLQESAHRNTLHPSSAKLDRQKRILSRTIPNCAKATTSARFTTDTPSTSSYNSADGIDFAPPRSYHEQEEDASEQYHHAWQQEDNYTKDRRPKIQLQTKGNRPSKRSSPRNSEDVVFARRPNPNSFHRRPLFRFGKNDFQSKITMNMLVVVMAFLVCLSPTINILCIVNSVTAFSTGCTLTEAYVMIILSANCAINPIIYGWRHPLFRKVFVCIIRGRLSEIERPATWLRRLLR